MKKCIFIFEIISLFSLGATNTLRISDMRSGAMGGNGVTLSYLFNPAMLEFSTGSVLSIDYFNRYAIKELGTIQGGFQYPNSYLSTGVQIVSFGYEQYRENLARVAFSKRLNAQWVLGISFQYAWIQSGLYEESPSRLSTDIGMVYSPVENLLIAVSIRDLPSIRLSVKDRSINNFQSYNVDFGIHWYVLNNLLITGYVGIEENIQVQGGFGMEYYVWDYFALRGGIQAHPFLPSFGAGFRWQRFGVDVMAIWHTTLGISSGIGLSYSF